MGFAAKAVHFGVELVEDGADRARDVGVVVGGESCPAGAEDADVDLGVEEGDLEAVGGHDVALGAWDAGDEATQAEPAQDCCSVRRSRSCQGWMNCGRES